MSILNQLTSQTGIKTSRKRVGRGDSSGWGGTAGKGHKGQKARSGKGKVRIGFEGGQTPMMRRLPKFGFTNASFKKNFRVITLGQLSQFTEEVNPETLWKAGLIKKNEMYKILVKGDITSTPTVYAHAFSATAKQKIEEAGGKVELIEIPKYVRPPKKKK